MTRTEYTALAREAEARYEHLRYTLQHDIDIVFVVSRDVYQAMVGYAEQDCPVWCYLFCL